MSQVLGMIPDDGYTETGVIREVVGLYPRLQFRFRPMLIEELVDYFQASEKLKGMQLRRLAVNYLITHVKEWDLQNAKSEVAPIDQATLLRLKEPLFRRLFAIVSTDTPADESPNQTEDDALANVDDVLTAAQSGKTVAEVREARERKN
jgi:hypothetical protein